MSEPEGIENILDDKLESLKENQVEKKHGGARPGAGFPKGAKKKKTLEAMKIREYFNQRVMKHVDDLFNAQYQLATGEQVLMVKIKERNSEGKVIRSYFEQVTDKETIKQYLDYEFANEGDDPNDEEHFYYLSTKPANNQALDSLMNRALGKVPERLEIEGRFFQSNEITIKVVGAKHADLDIGPDGQIVGVGDSAGGTDDERTPELGDVSSESPTSS